MNATETIQTVIVAIVIACAVAYASWRSYKALTAKGDACTGCPLKDSCKKGRRNRKGMTPVNL